MVKKAQNKIFKQYISVVILTIVSFITCTCFIQFTVQQNHKDYWDNYPAAEELYKTTKRKKGMIDAIKTISNKFIIKNK
jgi:mannitol-specific phosphotransferase system IIBC component